MGNCLHPSAKHLSPPSTKPCSQEDTGKHMAEQPSGRVAKRDKVHPIAQSPETRSLRIYTLAELKRATENFKPQALIGEGEFRKVFRGWVDKQTLNPTVSGCGMPVAVKRSYLENMQGLEEWMAEVSFAGRVSHPNIVKLLGCCRKDRELLLVSEFMPLGSLDKHLFACGTATKALSWSLRLRIAIGAARGLAFLHSLDKQIIYRDFKTSSILLDSRYNAKLSDFGLAKNGPTDDGSHVITKLKGSYAYAAPEYVATGHLYIKSDVYGFGVVLLEIFSGQRAFDPHHRSRKQHLVDWAKPYLTDYSKLSRVLDPKFKGQYPSKGALQVGQLILRCLSHHRKSRPSMQEAVEALEQIEVMKSKDAGDNLRHCKSSQDSASHPLPLPPRHCGVSPSAKVVRHSVKLL